LSGSRLCQGDETEASRRIKVGTFDGEGWSLCRSQRGSLHRLIFASRRVVIPASQRAVITE
jgi:hypothetical protein